MLAVTLDRKEINNMNKEEEVFNKDFPYLVQLRQDKQVKGYCIINELGELYSYITFYSIPYRAVFLTDLRDACWYESRALAAKRIDSLRSHCNVSGRLFIGHINKEEY